jgi:hypothetical protein
MEQLTPELERELQVEELWARRKVLASLANDTRLKDYKTRLTLASCFALTPVQSAETEEQSGDLAAAPLVHFEPAPAVPALESLPAIAIEPARNSGTFVRTACLVLALGLLATSSDKLASVFFHVQEKEARQQITARVENHILRTRHAAPKMARASDAPAAPSAPVNKPLEITAPQTAPQSAPAEGVQMINWPNLQGEAQKITAGGLKPSEAKPVTAATDHAAACTSDCADSDAIKTPSPKPAIKAHKASASLKKKDSKRSASRHGEHTSPAGNASENAALIPASGAGHSG